MPTLLEWATMPARVSRSVDGLRVVEGVAVHDDLVGHGVRAHRCLPAPLQRSGHRDHLPGAARLEHPGHREVEGRGQADQVRGVKLGYWAMARTFPVEGCMTTTVQ